MIVVIRCVVVIVVVVVCCDILVLLIGCYYIVGYLCLIVDCYIYRICCW